MVIRELIGRGVRKGRCICVRNPRDPGLHRDGRRAFLGSVEGIGRASLPRQYPLPAMTALSVLLGLGASFLCQYHQIAWVWIPDIYHLFAAQHGALLNLSVLLEPCCRVRTICLDG